MSRIKFLPAFFLTLGLLVAGALYYRVRDYQLADAQQRPVNSTDPAALSNAQNPSHPAAGMSDPSATGTIVEPGQALQPGQTASSREQRFNELLRAPLGGSAPNAQGNAPRTTAPPPPAEKPSLLQRLVSPIVNAFGGNKPAAQPAQLPPQQQQPPKSPSSRDGNPKQDNDPNSDTQPPQVQSVEFVPPQIHDGEETTIVIMATDDLSGIASVSGSVVSPSGAIQGFACQRDPQDPNRYTAKVQIPKDAAEGVWRLNFLSLTDNARNSVNLSGGLLPAAMFRVVSSNADSSGPTLKALWLDRPAMRAGEKNTLFAQAEDDKSGVTLVTGVFVSPHKFARIGFGCRPGQGNVWECELNESLVPRCLDCGVWQLEQVQLQDKANNMTTIRGDNQLVAQLRLDIAGDQCDATQPQLTAVQLDKNVVNNNEVNVVTATAIATDDMCGISSVSGQAVGPNVNGAQPRIYFSFDPAGDPNTFMGKITVPRLAAKGIWTISWIQVLDKGHNLKTYSQGDPALSGASFRVQ